MLDLRMLYLIVPLALGLCVGYLLRNRKRPDLNKTMLAVILVLIFSLGFTIGSNSELLNSFPTVGLSAFAMALLAVAFSILFVAIVRRRLKL